MANKPITAWHFTGTHLRDGRPVPEVGCVLVQAGPVILCERGLHASVEPFDALQYAPGPNLHLVECWGEVVRSDDKIACTHRRIVRSMDATPLLRYFARMQALSVAHLWEAPDVVLDYLMTGDEELRAAARDAAWAAARDAAWAAARDAARAAARDAAWAAARDAARDAARAAARDAARKDFNELVYESFGVKEKRRGK